MEDSQKETCQKSKSGHIRVTNDPELQIPPSFVVQLSESCRTQSPPFLLEKDGVALVSIFLSPHRQLVGQITKFVLPGGRARLLR